MCVCVCVCACVFVRVCVYERERGRERERERERARDTERGGRGWGGERRGGKERESNSDLAGSVKSNCQKSRTVSWLVPSNQIAKIVESKRANLT